MAEEEMREWEKARGGQESEELDRSVREEVLHGCEMARQLQCVLSSAEGPDLRHFTVEFSREIVGSFSRALYLLNSMPADWEEASIQRSHGRSKLVIPPVRDYTSDSPRSGSGARSHASGSPPSDTSEDRRLTAAMKKLKGGDSAEGPESPTRERVEISKNKKLLPKWSRRVPANAPPSGNDTPPDDGYAWRKYGQKDIFGAQYPRSYYRCTHKNDMGCQATKQVQRAEDDPSFFDVHYRGLHSCHIDRRLLQIHAPSSMPQIGSQRDSPISSALFFGTDRNLPSETSGVHGLSAAQFNLSSNQPSAPPYPFDFFSNRPDEGSSASSARQPNTGNTPENIYLSLFRRQANEGDNPADLFPLQSDQRAAFNEGELAMTILSESFSSPAASESNYIPLSPAMPLTYSMEGTHSMEGISAHGQQLQTSEPDNARDVSVHASADDSPMLDMDVMFNVDISELQL